MRWRALGEIYKMHSFAPFSWDPSKLNFLFENRFKNCQFFAKFDQICYIKFLSKFR